MKKIKPKQKKTIIKSRYQAIFENAVLGITITDDAGTILQANNRWLELMGYKRDEVIATDIMNFVSEDNRKADVGLIDQLMDDRVESYDIERKYLRKDGNVFWARLFMTILDSEKRIKLGMIQDITDEKLEKEVLERSEKRFRNIVKEVASEISITELSERTNNKMALQIEEINIELENMFKKELEENRRKEAVIIYQARLAAMGEMIGNIAHQWRQPLNNLGLIIANIEDAYHYDELDDQYLDSAVNKCKKLIQKMSDTIDDFRDFFNPNSTKSRFSIRDSILSTLDLLEENLRFHSIKVEFEDCEDLIGYGYSNQYLQSVFNIINNAIDSLASVDQDNKIIKICLSQDDKMATVDFKDNGAGFSEDVKSKIFDIYFTTKEGSKGTGLGLHITKTTIENNMNGRVEVIDSQIGANIRVSIPKATEEDQDG